MTITHRFNALLYSLFIWFSLSACNASLSNLINPPDADSEAETAGVVVEPVVQPTSIFSLTSNDIRATGIVLPAQEVNLSFAIEGRLLEIYVKEGDYVRKGDLLAQLDDSPQLISLATAKVNLAAIEAQLQAAKAGPTAEELIQVRADLTKAEAALTKLKNGPTPEQIGESEAQVNISKAELNNLLAGPKPAEIEAIAAQLQKAEVDLAAAQSDFDKVAFLAEIGSHPASIQLQKMTITYNQIQAEYNAKTSGPTPTEIAVAEARVKSAEAALARAKMAVAPEDILQAEATVAQAEARLAQLEAGSSQIEQDLLAIQKQMAEINIEQAELELEKTQLVAPFDGTVASILPNSGELISAGEPIILMGDTSAWYAITNELNEFDLANLETGASVEMNIEALPDSPFIGVVDSISPISEGARKLFEDGAEANYRLTVAITEGQLSELRWGMTIDMIIDTEPF